MSMSRDSRRQPGSLSGGEFSARVGSWETRESGGKTFTVYKVKIQSELGSWTVARRYSQFDDLNKRLAISNPSAALPLPKKKLVGNQNKDFIEQRRVALDKYVREICDDPRLANSQEFRSFIDTNLEAHTRVSKAGLSVSAQDGSSNGSGVPRKICVLGYMGVGKSCLTIQFTEGHFVDTYSPTIENTFSKQLKYRGVDYSVEILDTAGQDEYHIFHTRYAMGVHGYVLMYTVNLRRSFEMVETIHDKLVNAIGTSQVPRVLVGAKCDLVHERQVGSDEGYALAQQWGCPFFECSAKLNEKIDDIFLSLLAEIDKQREPEQQHESCTMQ
uniref:Rheb n=1 Tax=Hemiarma marina TaxID=1848298 RepID=A0A2R4IKX4_9CRYP|nr:Rheb [Hemiarma marina]